MKSDSKYEIQFSGLANGNHAFDWVLEPTFFEEEILDDIAQADLAVSIDLIKNDRMLNLNFHIAGKVMCTCDSCGDLCWIEINSTPQLIARFSQETNLTDDEVIFLSPAEYRLDLRQFIYEFVQLSLPAKKTHAPGKCNGNVLKYLTGRENDNIESNEKDPRWNALKKLKNNG